MMRTIYQIIAVAGLLLVLVPSILHFSGKVGPDQMKTYIFIGTMLWFAGAIPWLGKKKKEV